MSRPKDMKKKARRIRLLLLDVDGVLTDGGIYYTPEGVEFKRFNAQDGYGVRRAREGGIKVAIISGRSAGAVESRAKEMGVDELHQGISDKVAVSRDIQLRFGIVNEEVAFMGDDLFDLPLLEAVGLSAAPTNARPEVRKLVDFVSESRGGDGAVREFIDFILKHRGRDGGARRE
jgi:3-deoxy-D-manno-octulosonate 8-phosphate phosphatase (KDO 8-P phosphatase)